MSYAYAVKADGAYSLFTFEGLQPLDSGGACRAVMMRRTDIDVQVVELPAIGEKEIGGFLAYRIRSLYPGQPDQTAFDYRIVSRAGKRFAVLFLVQRETLEAYRALAQGRPLFASFDLLHPLLTRKLAAGDAVLLSWHDAWIEALLLAGDKPPRSLVIRRSDDPEGDFAQVVKAATGENGTARKWVAVCPDQERELLAGEMERQLGDGSSLEVVSTGEALRRMGRRPAFLFEPHRRGRMPPQKVRVQLLAFAILLLAVLAFKRSVDEDLRYLSRLKQAAHSQRSRSAQVMTLRQETDALEAELARLRKQRPVDAYLVLSELQSVLARGTRIQSFVIEKSSFQIEAVGSDTLQLMEAFRSRPLFDNVKLLQIVPVKASNQELFRITGNIRAE